MNKLFLTGLGTLGFSFCVLSQSVGVGTSTPDSNTILHVDIGNLHNKGFMVSGAVNFQAISPSVTAGSRLMFFPGRSAFRVGYTSGPEWSNYAVGSYSVAMGFRPRAEGSSSIALGSDVLANNGGAIAIGTSNIASGVQSTALGILTSSTAAYATSMGHSTIASGATSTAMGYQTVASGQYAIAGGSWAQATGINSLSLGAHTIAKNYAATAFGSGTNAGGHTSTAMGTATIAKGYASTVIGFYNDSLLTNDENSIAATTPLFIVGNGDNHFARANAFMIRKDGKIYVDPSEKNDGTTNGHLLLFGVPHSGEGIGSKRTPSGNRFGIDFYTGYQNRMAITQGGNVGIGITNPSNPLSFPAVLGKKISLYPGATGDVGFAVQGNQLLIYSDNPNAWIRLGYDQGGVFTNNFDVYGNGNAWLRGSLTQNSDERLKTNFSAITHALPLLSAISGYRYNWLDKNLDTEKQIGLKAQEVKEVFPELVKQDANGVLGINYSGLIPVLISALKEMEEKIKQQQKHIDRLSRVVLQLQQKN